MKTADIVIIGGGIIGTSIAYHLAQAGTKNVVLLEKNLIGSGSTGKAAGLTIHEWSTELDIRLVRGSLEIYKELIKGSGNELFHQSGLVYLASSKDNEDYLRKSEALLKKVGVQYEWLDKKALAGYLPVMNTSDFACGMFTPDDGYIDPYQVAYGFAQSARKKGVKIYEMTAVTGISVSNGKITAVHTNDGDIATPLVINAAGCWSKNIGNMLGLKFPLKPYRTQIAILKPPTLLPADMPAVYDMSRNVYFHGETGGLLLAGDGTTETEENPDMFRQHADDVFLEEIARKMSHLIPGMSDARVTNSWAGLCTATPDRLPIIGPISGIQGLILAGGSNGYGFMRAGMLGKLTVELALNRQPSMDIKSMFIDRFGNRDVFDFSIKQGMTV